MTNTDTTAASCTPLQMLPGHFHFADLHTTDVDGASRFYADMLGWQYEEIPGAPNRYVTAAVDGRGKAAITGLTDEHLAEGVQPYWFPYLWVDDIDATLAKVDGLGGKVEQPVYDVFDIGRMAVVTDPTGASFGLWQDLTTDQTVVKDEHGSPFWYELHTADLDAAMAFYAGLVGWKTDALQMGPDMTYHLIVPEQVDEQQTNAGGAMGLMDAERAANASSYWAVYFNVDDCDAAYARSLELGATTQMEPHDIPTAGRSCWIQDPQGATLAMMKPDPRTA